MRTLLTLLALLFGLSQAHAADVGIFNEPQSTVSSGSGGGSSPTTPGGTVTGANQYRTAGGTFGGDDNVVDDGSGGISAVLISATNVRGVTVSGTTLQQANRLTVQSTGTFSTRLQLNQAAGAFKFANSTPVDFVNMTAASPNPNGGMTIGGPGDPSATLHVVGTAIVTSGTMIGSSTIPTRPLTVVGLSTGAGTSYMCIDSVSGAVTINSTCTVSDETLKKDIQTIPYGLTDVLKLEPVAYQFKDEKYGKGYDIGLVAEDVELVIPEVVAHGDDGIASLNYPKLVPVLIKAIQELDARVKQLEAK